MSTFFLVLSAVLIGILEGVTEWLPVSSTGHMLLFDALFGMETAVSPAFYSFFLAFVQLGAVLAVVVLYFDRLNPWSRKKTVNEKKEAFRLWRCVLIGILPAALLGIPLDDLLEKYFYGVPVIAGALILYGVAFILIERRKKGRDARLERVYDISARDALGIGFFQALSLIPGTSRSGSTILGGMLLGASREASAEFSFFMAAPVMLGASFVRGIKFFASGVGMTANELLLLLIGTLVSFFVSIAVICFLMSFVKKHSFALFGWYRILLGAFVLLFLL